MKIEVLGSGCPTCAKLNEAVQAVVKKMKLESEVEYLTGTAGIQRIVELGAVSAPVLAINGEVAMTGFTPDLDKIEAVISKYQGA